MKAPQGLAAAPAAAAAPARSAAVPAVAAAPSKGKEESSVVAIPRGAAPAAAAPVAVPGAQVAVPAAQEAVAVSSAGEKWLADLNAGSDKVKKEMRNAVLEQTREILRQGKYVTEAGVTVELDTVGAAGGRHLFTGEEKHSSFPAPYNTTAHFVKADAIDTALFLLDKKGVNALVVVPVDPKNVGNGFPGSPSLEEQLYRRSTALLATEGPDFKYDIPSAGALYLPSVQVFREAEPRLGYQLTKAPRKVAFLLASSLEKPKYEAKGRSYVLTKSEEHDLLVAKATTILSAGLAKGHDAIVITAFGCGFNGAPPQVVAAVFRDLLTGKFSNTYKHVTFAILEDENCNKDHNPAGNLVPFQQEFLTVSRATSGAKCCAKKAAK